MVAVPHLCASALAFLLRRLDIYDLFVPDVSGGEPVPERRFDAVITTVPLAGVASDVVLELPQSFDRPVMVSVRGVTLPVRVSELDPMGDVAGLLQRYLLEGEQTALA